MKHKIKSIWEKRRIYAPLQKWEDKEHAKWLLYGAIVCIIGFLVGRFA